MPVGSDTASRPGSPAAGARDSRIVGYVTVRALLQPAPGAARDRYPNGERYGLYGVHQI
jgi:hypothetical protein